MRSLMTMSTCNVSAMSLQCLCRHIAKSLKSLRVVSECTVSRFPCTVYTQLIDFIEKKTTLSFEAVGAQCTILRIVHCAPRPTGEFTNG